MRTALPHSPPTTHLVKLSVFPFLKGFGQRILLSEGTRIDVW